MHRSWQIIRLILKTIWEQTTHWEGLVNIAAWIFLVLIFILPGPLFTKTLSEKIQANFLLSIAYLAVLPILITSIWNLGKANFNLESKLKPKLDLFFDSEIFIAQEVIDDMHNDVVTFKMFRVLVENLSLKSIDGVRVVLEKIVPHSGNLGRQPLRFFADHSTNQENSQNGKRLDPGDKEYVGVLYKYTSGEMSDEFLISYANKTLPNSMPLNEKYTFHLSATGINIIPTKKQFSVCFERPNIIVEQIDS